MIKPIKLRPLEREDLRFVHDLNNNQFVMRYWFEEPYEAYVELCDLYDKHIHDQTERRFVIECNQELVGLVELVEINHIHPHSSDESDKRSIVLPAKETCAIDASLE